MAFTTLTLDQRELDLLLRALTDLIAETKAALNLVPLELHQSETRQALGLMVGELLALEWRISEARRTV